jgi:hypothetical protein
LWLIGKPSGNEYHQELDFEESDQRPRWPVAAMLNDAPMLINVDSV